MRNVVSRLLICLSMLGLATKAAWAQVDQTGHYPLSAWQAHLASAKAGDPEGIAFRFAYLSSLGNERWPDIEALSNDGYGEATVKWLGYQLWLEQREGRAEPSAELKGRIENAARVLAVPNLRIILAVHAKTGLWATSWDQSANLVLKAQARTGSLEAITTACQLSATPVSLSASLTGFCQRAAKLGRPEAQYSLAVQHHARPDDFANGLETSIRTTLNVPHSVTKAIPLYRAAAVRGHAGAQARLAQLMAVGVKMKKDEAEARHLAMLATEQGNAEGKAVFGLLLLRGRGGSVEPEQARALLIQSARAGNRMAQMTLATLSLRGQGVKRDFVEGLTWVHLSELSERGDPPSAEADPLLLEPLRRTRAVARSINNAALDLDARIRAVQLRKELADSGEWPLVDPIPAAFPLQK